MDNMLSEGGMKEATWKAGRPSYRPCVDNY